MAWQQQHAIGDFSAMIGNDPQQLVAAAQWQQWQTYYQQYAQWQAQYGEQYQREMSRMQEQQPPLPPDQPQPPLPGPTNQPPPPPPLPSNAENQPPPQEPNKQQPSSSTISAPPRPSAQNLNQHHSKPPPPHNQQQQGQFQNNQKQQQYNSNNNNFNRKQNLNNQNNINNTQIWNRGQNPRNFNNYQGNNNNNNNQRGGGGFNNRQNNPRNQFQNNQQQTNQSLFNQQSENLQQPPPAMVEAPKPVNLDQSQQHDRDDPDERMFDDQFKKWEEEFLNWKKENQHHPDRQSYFEYEKKFEEVRHKLLERRDQMRQRKKEEMAAKMLVKPIQAPDLSKFDVNPIQEELPKPKAQKSLVPIENIGSLFNKSDSGGIPGLDLVEEKPSTAPKVVILKVEKVEDVSAVVTKALDLERSEIDEKTEAKKEKPSRWSFESNRKSAEKKPYNPASWGKKKVNPPQEGNIGQSSKIPDQIADISKNINITDLLQNPNILNLLSKMKGDQEPRTPVEPLSVVQSPFQSNLPIQQGPVRLNPAFDNRPYQDEDERISQPFPNMNPNANPIMNPNMNPNMNQTRNSNMNPNMNPNMNHSRNSNMNPTMNPNFNPNMHPNLRGPNPNMNPNVRGQNPNMNPNMNPNANMNPHMNPNMNSNMNQNLRMGGWDNGPNPRGFPINHPRFPNQNNVRNMGPPFRNNNFRHPFNMNNNRTPFNGPMDMDFRQFPNPRMMAPEQADPWSNQNIEITFNEDEEDFRPVKVIDYSNQSAGRTGPECEILLPAKVVDYGHKSANINEDDSPSFFLNSVKTFDYGHSGLSRGGFPGGRNQNNNGQQHQNWQNNNAGWNNNGGAIARATRGKKRNRQMNNRNTEMPKRSREKDQSNSRDGSDWNQPGFDSQRENKSKKEKHVVNQEFLEGISDDEMNCEDRNQDYEDGEDDNYSLPSVEDNPFPERSRIDIPQDRKMDPNTISIEEILYNPGRKSRPKKIFIILRGLPGSGKTHVAKLIKDKEVEMGGSAPRILSIDDYFTTETDEVVICATTGKEINKRTLSYEYDKDMEERYLQYLLKAFRKNVTDGYFDFIIVDAANDKLSTLNEFVAFAKSKGFMPYICSLNEDVETCTNRNIHKRTESEIQQIYNGFEESPTSEVKLDVTALLEGDDIPEIDMEEISNDEFDEEEEQKEKSEKCEENDEAEEEENGGNEEENDLEECDEFKSKWDTDPTDEKLAKLDGTSKPLRHTTIEDFLQNDEYLTANEELPPGKKRVRWADIEEKKAQEKMRAIGFVVGQTDWQRMMDPSEGQSALTKTKYIERVTKGGSPT